MSACPSGTVFLSAYFRNTVRIFRERCPRVIRTLSQIGKNHQYGDSAYYLDPYSDGADLDELMKYEVVSPNAVLKKYTWANSAKALAKVIEHMA